MNIVCLVLAPTLLLVGCSGEPAFEDIKYDSRLSAGELRSQCESPSPHAQNVCSAYIVGIADAHSYSAGVHGEPWLCGRPTNLAIVSAVRAYLGVHPEKAHTGAAEAVTVALRAAYAGRCG